MQSMGKEREKNRKREKIKFEFKNNDYCVFSNSAI